MITKSSLSCQSFFMRSLAYFLSLLLVLNPVAPAVASVLSNSSIQHDLAVNPFFINEPSNNYQYRAPAFAEWSTSSALSLESVYSRLIEEKPAAISEPTYVPIDVSGITIFIPTYTRYKYLGSPAVQARYIRTQITTLLGRNLIDAAGQSSLYGTEAKQLNTLFGNAIDYAIEANKIYGENLNLDQESTGLAKDMVWPELRTINGKQLIVPVVYLTADTIRERRVVDNEIELPRDTQISELNVVNSDLKVERDSFLQVAGDLSLTNSNLTSDGALKIVAGGAFDNASSVVRANGNLEIGAKSIQNRTIVYRYDLGHEQGTRYGEIANIASNDGDVVLRSHSDIQFNGADTSAENGAITLAANGNILIGTQELYSGSTSRFGSGTQTRSEVSYLQSHITAEDTIKLIAGGQIVIDAAEIVSDKGHIELLASMGISVVDSVGQFQSQASGKFGKKKVDESIYQTTSIRALLDAGKGIKLNTEFGDISLRAADITSADGTSVSAKNGAVNLLMTTETDHYSYSSVKKGIFTTKTVNKGHNIETGVPNSIVGGFAVEALAGITVEYEGNPDLTTEQQLDEIAGMPGMAWIDEVRNHPDVDWNEILLEHEEWYDKNTSLSPAFAAVVAIAVAVATQGAAAGWAASISGSLGSVGSTAFVSGAIQAGVSSFISQATLAAANGAVNGDIAGAMEDFASSETLKSLAVAMVTAGAIAELDAAFFNVDSAGIAEATEAVETASTAVQAQAGVNSVVSATNATATGMSLTSQALQAVTHATVQAGAQAVITGADFEDGFVQALITSSLATVGEKLANKIGDAKANNQIGTATQLISHAAVGCLTGSLTAASTGGDAEEGCASGGGGAVIGELIGLAYASDLEEDLGEWVEEQTAEGVVLNQDDVMAQAMEFKRRGADMAKLGAALTAFAAGGDVDIAAMAGQNAAENNAFFLVVVVAIAAYTSYVSYTEGGLYEGLQSIGRGDDPLAQAIGAAVEEGVELAAEHYPEETQKAAQILNAVGEKVSAGVQVVIETGPGQTVTKFWNEIPQEKRDALIGAGAVVSMAIPAGTIAKLKALSHMDVEAGDWVKDPNHKNWEDVSPEHQEILNRPPRAEDIGVINSNLSIPEQNPGTAQSRINLAKVTKDPELPADSTAVRGLEYALDKHGKMAESGSAKSKFLVSDEVVKNILQRRDVVQSPVYNQLDFDGNIVETKFVRQVDIGEVIGTTKLPGGEVGNTSIITVITNRSGDVINVYPGEI